MTSDGCSVPKMVKRNFPAFRDFCDRCDATVCAVHDEAYGHGGSAADRIVADYALFVGAREACGDFIAAEVFDAVRNFGSTHWGLGPWHGGDRAWPEPIEAP